MFRNITVAIDGSAHAWRALDAACDLAKRYDADIHLIHVPEFPQPAMTVGMMAVQTPIDMEALIGAGQAIMAEAAERARKLGVEPHSQIVQAGAPAELIVHAAQANGTDLLVTGRRGMNGVASLLLGSTSQQIARSAQCACLTIK